MFRLFLNAFMTWTGKCLPLRNHFPVMVAQIRFFCNPMEQSSCSEANSFSANKFLTVDEIRKFTTNVIMSLILSLNESDNSRSLLSIPFPKIPFDTIIIPTPRPSKWPPYSGDPHKKIYVLFLSQPQDVLLSYVCYIEILSHSIVITLCNIIKQRVNILFNALKLHTETPILIMNTIIISEPC